MALSPPVTVCFPTLPRTVWKLSFCLYSFRLKLSSKYCQNTDFTFCIQSKTYYIIGHIFIISEYLWRQTLTTIAIFPIHFCLILSNVGRYPFILIVALPSHSDIFNSFMNVIYNTIILHDSSLDQQRYFHDSSSHHFSLVITDFFIILFIIFLYIVIPYSVLELSKFFLTNYFCWKGLSIINPFSICNLCQLLKPNTQ